MIIFADFETRAGPAAPNLRTAGAYRYAHAADAIVLAYAIEDGPVRVVSKGGAALSWADLPELHDLFEEATFVAWNAGFDRAVWNYSLIDSPFLAPGKTKDAMAVALANNLPPDLERASTAIGGRGKLADGKRLIAKFCGAAAAAPVDLKDPDWQRFITYASIDVQQLRRVWRVMRPLPEEEWDVYRVSEAINDRGIPVDLDFVRHAARLAAIDSHRTNTRIEELTKGVLTSVFQHKKIPEWAYGRLLSAEARAILVSHVIDAEEDENALTVEEEDVEAPGGEIVYTCKRPNVVQLLDFLRKNGDPDPVVRQVMELREYGAGASPKKFNAILEQNIGGRLFGQFAFNGASTGRFAGRGVQPQNLTRTVLGTDPSDDYGTWEPSTVDLIADGCDWDTLDRHGLGEPVAKKLALTVRPAVMAPWGKTLIKCDYSQVEARMLAFLSADKAALPILDAFARSDADPKAPDLYRLTAASMLHKPVEEISGDERQRGKVAILACGYGGGAPALIGMATKYGMYLSREEAQEIVDLWRRANPWADRFWGKHTRDHSYGLMGAAMRAINAPGTGQRAGRILFTFVESYLGGSLLMRLPSGRILTYPWCRIRDYTVKDKQTKKVVDERRGLTYRHGKEFYPLYGGRFAAPATQGAAADLLRSSLVALEGRLDVIMHAHDEIVVEAAEADAERAAATLTEVMEAERPWTKGLPLAVDTTIRFYYSSAKLKEDVQHALQRSA